jgi:hypothetical protein
MVVKSPVCLLERRKTMVSKEDFQVPEESQGVVCEESQQTEPEESQEVVCEEYQETPSEESEETPVEVEDNW